MYSTVEAPATCLPPPPPVPPPSASYAFLAKPPKHKHKPQPIIVRCAPPRALSRSATPRRRPSVSSSPAFQANFLVLVDTPTPTSDTPKTPKTPHLTTHGYTAAFSSLYQRRGSLPDTPRSPRRVPISPKRGSAPRSTPSTPKRPSGPGSPKRRHHRRVSTPTSPFAPPSPTRVQPRPPVKFTAPTPCPAPGLAPPQRAPKLSKFRSFATLRSRTPSPAPPSRTASPMPLPTTSTPKPSAKRTKRSATPARGSEAYNKYRPRPFIQQMQMIQLLEGGSLDSHIRRHHVYAGQGAAHTGFAIDQETHGYAFTDERGMIWFDEEEEWEFACLLPQTQPREKRGILRFLGRRRDEQGEEEEWEDFMESEEQEQEQDDDMDLSVLLAREDDELRASQDDLAAFGGALEGPWARNEPLPSVLRLPEVKSNRKTKRRCIRRATDSLDIARIAPSAPTVPTTVLKKEFLAEAFAPAPRLEPPSFFPSSAASPPRTTSPFRVFAGKAHHRHARSVPDTKEAPTFVSLGSSMRGGAVLDSKLDVPPSPSPSVQWTPEPTLSNKSLAVPADTRLMTVSPPPAAARRLGIDPSATVALQPPLAPAKKPGFMGMRKHRA